MEKVLIGYGQTELSPVNHMTLPEDSLENRTQTVGRPIPHIEVKIVDADNRVVPIGEQGEICTRGYSVMKGYWGDDEKTAETIVDGWKARRLPRKRFATIARARSRITRFLATCASSTSIR